MKHLLFVAALSLGLTGVCFAQTSTPNSQTQEQPSAAPNGPGGPNASGQQGMQKPCNTQASGTSDREGGNAKAAATGSSAYGNGNANGMVKGGC
jgi:hypothetical protein